ncbi:GNAT family N-acetyltransferase [Candidatus Bipolaricaulota bacterium]|nr:GNAT family N-acetyltransferase [Candidatus Bipolaricaulota bacterium]
MKIRVGTKEDAPAIGRLIATTYRTYNLSHADPEEQDRLLGPFRNAFSDDPKHREAILGVVPSPMLYVAVDRDKIVGVLRGRKNILASLFVGGAYHRRGVGRMLVERFEKDSRKLGVNWIRVAATLYAVPFYQSMGYKKTIGVRRCHSFEGTDLKQQPMKKRFTKR